MSHHDFDAYQYLSTEKGCVHQISDCIKVAIEKSAHGRYIVAISSADEVLVLPHFNASVRNDLGWLYDTDSGYIFSTTTRSA